MPAQLVSRDIWTHGSGQPLQDLLRSALASLLMLGSGSRPAYFVSPWITDFDLFDNRFGNYTALFPHLADAPSIRFGDFLLRLSRNTDVRIITTDNMRSRTFLMDHRIRSTSLIACRFGDSLEHEKGILAPTFYIEGSMNITHFGVRVRGEKVVYHAVLGDGVPQKIAGAYLEFERHWTVLA
jgi:hypothetical protein